MTAKKRAYSREFKRGPTAEKRRSIAVVAPFTLAKAFRAKVKRLGLSQRALILGWIKRWTEEP
jgi:hypothetical protein